MNTFNPPCGGGKENPNAPLYRSNERNDKPANRYFVGGTDNHTIPCNGPNEPLEEHAVFVREESGRFYFTVGGNTVYVLSEDVVRLPDGTYKIKGNIYNEF